MSYSLNSSVDDCYEGTTCLINKMDIRDEIIHSTIEAEITAAKSAILSEAPFKQDFDFSEIDPDKLMIATMHSAHGIKDFISDIFFRSVRK